MNPSGVTYVVSDMHLAEGNLGKGITLGTENFFSDHSFQNFVEYLINDGGQGSHLVLNGDFVDFIRITEVPEKSTSHIWAKEVLKSGSQAPINMSHVSPKEKIFGLKTNDYKCIWKLYLSINGHVPVFEALAKWISTGNYLTIIVGNHDPEWHWPKLQDYFKVKLLELAKDRYLNDTWEESDFLGNHRIRFSDTHIDVANTIRIEHGHVYDRMTKLCPELELHKCVDKFKRRGSELKEYEKELALPLGSFFNRYLVNKVEIIFPNADNLKTNKALFQAIIDEDFLSALKIIYLYLGYTLKVVLKSFSKSLLSLGVYIGVTVLPAALVIYLSYRSIMREGPFLEGLPSWLSFIADWVTNILPIAARYILKFLFEFFEISAKPLPKAIVIDMKPGNRLFNYDTVIVGHNHSPEIKYLKNGKQYVNTGTWTSKYVFKFKQIQAGTKYAFAKIEEFQNIKPQVGLLEWDNHSKLARDLTSFKKD